jgi:hypothetical protein
MIRALQALPASHYYLMLVVVLFAGGLFISATRITDAPAAPAAPLPPVPEVAISPRVGAAAPDFRLPTISGDPISLSESARPGRARQHLGYLVPTLPGGDAGDAGRLRARAQ